MTDTQPTHPAPTRSGPGPFGRFARYLLVAILFFAVGTYAGYFAFLWAGPSGPITTETYREGEGDRKVAVLPMKGFIDAKKAAFTHDAVEALLDNDAVGALVLRVNSPGGSAAASDRIWHQLQRMRDRLKEEGRDIPLVASYGGMAASGGYYVSTAADHIVAQPACVTGSIGVIAQALTFEKLLKKKLGIQPEVITSEHATKKDLLSPLKSWKKESRQEMKDILNAAEERFIEVVNKGRSLDRSEVLELATGETFTAKRAKKAGLVDSIGYLDDAIRIARKQGDFEEKRPPVVIYRKRQPLLQSLAGVTADRTRRPIDAERIRKWMTQLSTPKRMYVVRP